MAGIGEALGVISLLEPAFTACTKAYGFYKLTKNFGQDYQQAERGLRGQMARLKLIGDTRIQDLISVPEDGTQLAATAIWTLQNMRNNIELCESLMKKYGEPKGGEFNRNPPTKNWLKLEDSAGSTRHPSTSSQALSMVSVADTAQPSPAESTREIKPKHTLFSRRNRPSSSASSFVGHSASTSTTEVSPSSATSHSSIGSLNDPRVLKGIRDDSHQARSLQSSSTILGRLKWASDDRSRFKSAVEDLSKANDLLETLLKIKPPEDPTFLPSSGRVNQTTAHFISSTKAALEGLHSDLLSINPQSGRDVEFSLKLVLDETDKKAYADYVDTYFDADSLVFSLQAHSKSIHGKNQKSFYLLAETPISKEIAVPVISDLVSTFQQTDPDAEPNFHCLGPVIAQSEKQKLRIYQDKTSEWHRTHTLADALQDQIFQDISFQRHYSQLGLFMAFSYVALPFAYRGQSQFPQPSNYSYYDQVSVQDSESATNNSTERSHEYTVADTPTITVEGDDQSHISGVDPEAAFQELQSPYISFNFGSRRRMSTKTLGKRPGFIAVTHNPVVALGLLLYQIGSWRHMPPGDIVQMRRDALDRSHDLIRLSGVEFADITRTCLNWKEAGPNGKRFDNEEMLIKVYARLDEYNKSLQSLM